MTAFTSEETPLAPENVQTINQIVQTRMANCQFDLIIIGAGINGAGIARDASMRGLRVLLIDKGDIASGTSSGSTRLIHGGLRYLEHGEIGLVRESLRERETLLKIAPHLVKPLPILIPIYKNANRSWLKIKAGLLAYDLLSLAKSLPRHRMLSRDELLKQSAGLNDEGLVGGAVYHDCQVQLAERLVLENALCAKNHGAEVLTYTRVIGAHDGSVEFVRKDRTRHEFASAPVIINASGPWIDKVNGSRSGRLIGGTKGSHLVVKPFPGCPQSTIYVEAQSDRRPFFVIPWNSNYLIGTTDVRFEGDPDEVTVEEWEIEYLLNETNRIFTAARLQPTDVCYVYSGVRPLPYSRDENERSITRRHFLRESPNDKNFLSIVGGKLTTYRSLAEQCVDLVLKKLGKRAVPCSTHTVPLPGGAKENKHEFNFAQRSLVYGSRVDELARVCERHTDLAKPLTPETDVLAGEIVFAFESEFAETLADCFLRRNMIGLSCNQGVGADEAAAKIGNRFLGWTEERAIKEVEDYRREISRMRYHLLQQRGVSTWR